MINNTLFIGNDQILAVYGLKDKVTDTYINNATVTATVKTTAGVAVPGQSFPMTLAYVASSNGDYRGTLEDGLTLLPNKQYVVEVTADAGNDLIGFFRYYAYASHRQQ